MKRYPQLRRLRLRLAVCFATCTGIASSGAAFAQVPDRVTIDARRCTEIESADERLACFEAEVDEARERNEAAAPAPASSPTPAVPQPARTVDLTRVRDRDEGAEQRTEWFGTIASLTERTPNRYLITLDSGEIWLQTVAERYPLRVGRRVRIYDAKWGSNQRLEVDGVNGFIQVQRVR